MTIDTKSSNPKDSVATNKLDLTVVPDSMIVAAAIGFTEGAFKYGRYNWRIDGVSAATYIAALRRHIGAWMAGEECDPTTNVPHLSSALCCIAIIIDAQVQENIIDDRPPAQPKFADWQRAQETTVKNLREMFKSFSPKQYTIADKPTESRTDFRDTSYWRVTPADVAEYTKKQTTKPEYDYTKIP